MRQQYHSIIRPERNGWFVGWVEEMPGTLTRAQSVDECRRKLRASLELIIQTHRDDARIGLTPSCILEPIEVEVGDDVSLLAAAY